MEAFANCVAKLSLAVTGLTASYGIYTSIDTYREMNIPRFYDRSTPLQIMKMQHFSDFDEIKRSVYYLQRIHDLSVCENPSKQQIAFVLHNIKSLPSYTEAVDGVIRGYAEKANNTPNGWINAVDIPNAPCLKRRSRECSTQDLLVDLHTSMDKRFKTDYDLLSSPSNHGFY